MSPPMPFHSSERRGSSVYRGRGRSNRGISFHRGRGRFNRFRGRSPIHQPVNHSPAFQREGSQSVRGRSPLPRLQTSSRDESTFSANRGSMPINPSPQQATSTEGEFAISADRGLPTLRSPRISASLFIERDPVIPRGRSDSKVKSPEMPGDRSDSPLRNPSIPASSVAGQPTIAGAREYVAPECLSIPTPSVEELVGGIGGPKSRRPSIPAFPSSSEEPAMLGGRDDLRPSTPSAQVSPLLGEQFFPADLSDSDSKPLSIRVASSNKKLLSAATAARKAHPYPPPTVEKLDQFRRDCGIEAALRGDCTEDELVFKYLSFLPKGLETRPNLRNAVEETLLSKFLMDNFRTDVKGKLVTLGIKRHFLGKVVEAANRKAKRENLGSAEALQRYKEIREQSLGTILAAKGVKAGYFPDDLGGSYDPANYPSKFVNISFFLFTPTNVYHPLQTNRQHNIRFL